MRVVLVGPPAVRRRLRDRMGDLDIVAEAATITAARRVDGAVDAYVVAAGPDERDEAAIDPLTPRETEVLWLLADGLSNGTIAERLGVSAETVKFHLASIFGKLGAANRTDAVRRALRRGLVPL